MPCFYFVIAKSIFEKIKKDNMALQKNYPLSVFVTFYTQKIIIEDVDIL